MTHFSKKLQAHFGVKKRGGKVAEKCLAPPGEGGNSEAKNRNGETQRIRSCEKEEMWEEIGIVLSAGHLIELANFSFARFFD